MPTDFNKDVTKDTINTLTRLLYYAGIAQEKGDVAYLEIGNYEQKVVIKLGKVKD